MDEDGLLLAPTALRAVLEGLPDATVAADADLRIVFANALAEQLFGRTHAELVGQPLELLWPERVRERYVRNAQLYFATEHPLRFSLRAYGLRSDGSEFVGEMSWGIVETDGGPLLLAIGRDISERSAAERRMRHEALHDPLTGLANRALCHDRLRVALARTGRTSGAACVLFVDLDNFKRVNDVYGHAAGDALLIALGRRLAATVRPADTVARLGGDEFVVVCDEIEQDVAVMLGARLEEAIREPLVVGGVEHRMSASIGIALGGPGTSPDGLLADADAAAYRAKAAGRARVELFDTRARRHAAERVRTAEALERALSLGQLRLAFQPIVALADGAVVGQEALLRWDRPGSGASAPADFIPVAEESALIVEIGAWVLRQACAEATRAGGSVWVNMSGRQLAQPDLPELVRACLDAASLAPERLRLELTEAVLLHAPAQGARNLAELKRLGIGLVLDDFGTGYSSLGNLRDSSVDALKIDRSFVAGLVGSSGEAAIVAAVISLAAALGLVVVAEGVEDEAQAAALRELGCPFAQGFLFGGPV